MTERTPRELEEIEQTRNRRTTLYSIEAKHASGSILRAQALTEANLSSFKSWLEREGYAAEITAVTL